MKNLEEFNIRKDDLCGACHIHTSIKDPFFYACNRHDRNYSVITTNNPRWEELAKEADEQFLLDMKNIIKITGSWWLYPRAYLYYRLSRFYGKKVIEKRCRRTNGSL